MTRKSKSIFIGLLFFLIFKSLYSQNDTISHKLIFSASYGLAIPLGKFATYEPYNIYTNNQTNYCGPPSNGFYFKIDATYLFFKYLGLSCSYLNTTNQAESLTSEDVFLKGGGLGGGSVIDSYNYLTKKWQSDNILVGLSTQLNTGLLKIKCRISSGFQKIRSPETHIYGTGHNWTTYNSGQTTSYTYSTIQSSVTTNNFVLGVGIDFRFKLKKNVGIVLNFDYLHSLANFNGTLLQDYNDGTSQSYSGRQLSNNFNKQISILALGVGLTYELR